MLDSKLSTGMVPCESKFAVDFVSNCTLLVESINLV